MSAKFGVFDTIDHVWLGEPNGPKLFEDQMVNGRMLSGKQLAELAALVINKRLGYHPTRCQVREFQENSLRFVDTVQALISGEEAIRQLEDGV